MIPGTEIPPVRRLADVTSLDRVLVDLLELLPQHLLVLDDLRLASVLSQLELSIALMPRPMELQAVEQDADMAFPTVVDDPPRRIRFER